MLSVPVAIALLLVTADLKSLKKLSGRILFSFFLAIVGVLIGGVIACYLFYPGIPDTKLVVAMITGGYIGSAPNMIAVGQMLGAGSETFIVVNASDMICGFIYLVFLTSVAKKTLSLFLKRKVIYEIQTNPEPAHVTAGGKNWPRIILQLTVFSAIVCAVSVGLSFLIAGKINETIVIISITTLSIIASFNSKLRNIPMSYETGQYLLLVFAISMGMLSDFQDLFRNSGDYIFLIGTFLFLAVVLHFLFSFLFKTDADTVIIASTASIFGPPFVGQVGEAIKNQQLILPGIIMGILGYAVGNYLGLLMFYFLQFYFYT